MRGEGRRALRPRVTSAGPYEPPTPARERPQHAHQAARSRYRTARYARIQCDAGKALTPSVSAEPRALAADPLK
jgi:hypothetical protein